MVSDTLHLGRHNPHNQVLKMEVERERALEAVLGNLVFHLQHQCLAQHIYTRESVRGRTGQSYTHLPAIQPKNSEQRKIYIPTLFVWANTESSQISPWFKNE